MFKFPLIYWFTELFRIILLFPVLGLSSQVFISLPTESCCCSFNSSFYFLIFINYSLISAFYEAVLCLLISSSLNFSVKLALFSTILSNYTSTYDWLLLEALVYFYSAMSVEKAFLFSSIPYIWNESYLWWVLSLSKFLLIKFPPIFFSKRNDFSYYSEFLISTMLLCFSIF